MEGVFKVITWKDVPGTNRINGLAFPTNLGDGLERPILNDKKIFQFGDALAMVLADTPEQAEAAAAKVVVEIEELLPYMSAPAAMADDAIEIHPGTPNIYFQTNIVKGDDPAPLMETLPNIIEDDFYVGRQPHLPLEPDVGFAYFDEEDNLMVHSKSIALHFHQLMTAEAIGVDPTKYFIAQNPTGGTFGYKFSPTIEGLSRIQYVPTNHLHRKTFTILYECKIRGR
jgi:aldehyde oxidoreductase